MATQDQVNALTDQLNQASSDLVAAEASIQADIAALPDVTQLETAIAGFEDAAKTIAAIKAVQAPAAQPAPDEVLPSDTEPAADALGEPSPVPLAS